ncbi:MAG: hypothetical protein K8R88_09535 [Armatimonadetes bacterium]|nr:hypothetical protein [Armatimonadota bacterium]
MKPIFQPEWRSQNRAKRKFYAKYMSWIEKGGYFVVLCVFGAFVFAFNYPVDDVVKAESVPIEAASVAIKSDQDAMVIQTLVNDFDEVKEGQPIMILAEGEMQIALCKQARLAEELKEIGQRDPRALDTGLPKGRTVLAPASGTFHFLPSETAIAKGEPIAKILDYKTLILNAELEGTTIGQAAENQTARITAINMNAGSSTLFRGGANGEDILSGSLVGNEVKDELERQLKGSTVLVRDDIPVTVEGVKQVQIDSQVNLAPGTPNLQTKQAEPSVNYVLLGKVESGTPIGTVQIALPSDLSESSVKTIEKAAAGQNFRTPEGKSYSISKLKGTNFVVQLNVKGAAGASTNSLAATAISRKFAAKIKVTSPPQFLIDAVKAADRNGKAITARVEVVTGTRPIAKLLLKKS